MKAYVTNSNAKSIVFKLDVEGIDIEQEVYKIDFRWFSKHEIKSLLAFKLLFQNPKTFFSKYKRRTSSDRKKFVFEGQSPAHHKSPSCERLLSNFLNYKIPEEIKIKGDDAITEFRNWFKENMYLMDDKMELFLDKMRYRFGLKKRPEVVDFKNSGTEAIESLDLNFLENQIDLLIKNANSFYKSSSKTQIILDHFGTNSFIWKEKKAPYNNQTSYSNEVIWNTLKEFEETYKTPIAYHLREYYRVKFNPELEFEGHLLEQLGFQPCRQCYDSNYLFNFDLNEDNTQEPPITDALEAYKPKTNNNDGSDLPF